MSDLTQTEDLASQQSRSLRPGDLMTFSLFPEASCQYTSRFHEAQAFRDSAVPASQWVKARFPDLFLEPSATLSPFLPTPAQSLHVQEADHFVTVVGEASAMSDGSCWGWSKLRILFRRAPEREPDLEQPWKTHF